MTAGNQPSSSGSAGPSSPGTADAFLIVKRGLFFRPNCQGYTGIRDEAGRYSEEAARYHAEHGECTLIHADDAPEFMPAAYSDLVIKHLTLQRDEMRREVERLRGVAQAERPYCDPVEQGKAFYLAMYEKKGAIWNANEHQELWVDLARDYERRRREVSSVPSTHSQSLQNRDEMLRGLAEFFSESVHLVWSNDEIADCLTGMTGDGSQVTSTDGKSP